MDNQPKVIPELQKAPGSHRDGLTPIKQIEDLDRRRFRIAIKSVHYYTETRDRICCAVLLETSFMLRESDKLAYARVPLSAQDLKPSNKTASAGGEDVAGDKINISDYYPPGEEYMEVGRDVGTKTILAAPVLKADVMGNGGEVSNLGYEKQLKVDKSYLISLKPFFTNVEGLPTTLDWRFEDDNRIFYPGSISLLVVVTKYTDANELWFPFELTLQWQLRVDIHGLINRVIRLVARPDKHEGWKFSIRGSYRPDLAKDALADAISAKDKVTPSLQVGLNAAMQPWVDAHTRSSIFEKKNAPSEAPLSDAGARSS